MDTIQMQLKMKALSLNTIAPPDLPFPFEDINWRIL
jgi:hypothetical protein